MGHEKVLLGLERSIEEDSLSHAYLFHGPSDVGKRHVAQLFAKILLCENNFCHECSDCRALDSGVHPDFVQLMDGGESLKIGAVRQLIHTVSQTSQGKRRVVLVENIERMPREAQNAFLKTLEEPPGETIFLLTASHPEKVLPTILSRVRLLEFGHVSELDLSAYLLSQFEALERPVLEQVLEIAQGRPGLAIRLTENPLELARYRELFYTIEGFLDHNDLLEKFKYVEAIEKDPEALEYFFEVTALVLRKRMYAEVHLSEKNIKKRFSLPQITDLFEKLLETRYLIQRNVNKKLALENFFLCTEV